jgi:hypothetical protein
VVTSRQEEVRDLDKATLQAVRLAFDTTQREPSRPNATDQDDENEVEDESGRGCGGGRRVERIEMRPLRSIYAGDCGILMCERTNRNTHARTR